MRKQNKISIILFILLIFVQTGLFCFGTQPGAPFFSIELTVGYLMSPMYMDTGLIMEGNIGSLFLWHAGGYYLNMIYTMPLGWTGDLGFGFVLFSESKNSKWTVIYKDGNRNSIDRGVSLMNIYHTIDFGGMYSHMSNSDPDDSITDFSHTTILGYAGYRFFNLYDIIGQPIQHLKFRMYGIAGAREMFDSDDIEPYHFIWGFIAAMEWWICSFELTYLEDNISFRYGLHLSMGFLSSKQE